MSDINNNCRTAATLFTRSECECILANVFAGVDVDVTLKDFVVQPEENAVGFLGQYFHLDLIFMAHQPEGHRVEQLKRLFVKTLPYRNPELSMYIARTGILRKEATLYGTLLRSLRSFSKSPWSPQCFFTRDDLVVIENVNCLNFRTSTSSTGSLPRSELRSLLKGLAAMHASSIAYEVHNQLYIGDVYDCMLQEITVSPKEDYFTTGLRAILAIANVHPDYRSPEHQSFIRNRLEKELESVYDMVNPSQRYRNVFCHRDSWGGNVFFGGHKEEVMFVDFQTCRYCPPAIDVVFALYMNLESEDRRRAADIHEYLAWYYKCFQVALADLDLNADEHMSREDFEDSYREFELFGLLYKAIAATILRVPAGYLSEMKLHRPEEYYRYAYVDRTADVLRLMSENAMFREHMLECVADMIDLLLRGVTGR